MCMPQRGFSSRVSGKKVAISVHAWEKIKYATREEEDDSDECEVAHLRSEGTRTRVRIIVFLPCSINIYFLTKIGVISQCTLLLARYKDFNDLSTFLCLPNNTISQILQNTLLFPIPLLRSTQIAYHTAISWGLGTDNSRWGTSLENTVDAEAIRNPIHDSLPV